MQSRMPVRERLLLVLSDREIFDISARVRASVAGVKSRLARTMLAQGMSARRPRRTARLR